jgi:hypothetical protein
MEEVHTHTNTSLAKEAKDVLCCLAGRHVPQAMSTFHKPRGTNSRAAESVYESAAHATQSYLTSRLHANIMEHSKSKRRWRLLPLGTHVNVTVSGSSGATHWKVNLGIDW